MNPSLTNAQRAQIIELAEKERVKAYIARKVGVSRSTVTKVLQEQGKKKDAGVFDVDSYKQDLHTI